MKRTYLEEDLELIKRYFPGAKRTTIRTPFDLSEPKRHLPRISADSYREADWPKARWIGGVLWMN